MWFRRFASSIVMPRLSIGLPVLASKIARTSRGHHASHDRRRLRVVVGPVVVEVAAMRAGGLPRGEPIAHVLRARIGAAGRGRPHDGEELGQVLLAAQVRRRRVLHRVDHVGTDGRRAERQRLHAAVEHEAPVDGAVE
jgi:hypothetical protein